MEDQEFRGKIRALADDAPDLRTLVCGILELVQSIIDPAWLMNSKDAPPVLGKKRKLCAAPERQINLETLQRNPSDSQKDYWNELIEGQKRLVRQYLILTRLKISGGAQIATHEITSFIKRYIVIADGKSGFVNTSLTRLKETEAVEPVAGQRGLYIGLEGLDDVYAKTGHFHAPGFQTVKDRLGLPDPWPKSQ